MRFFFCKICGENKQHYAKGLCKKCYRKKYMETYTKKYNQQIRKPRILEHVKDVCLECGFSSDVVNAIVLDGIVLDNKMKERGII